MPSLFHEYWKWWASPYINHFLQPDTIIPSPASSQSWNRYLYVQNNPVRFNDPTGHWVTEGDGGGNITEQMKKDDQAKVEYVRQRSEYYKCKAGDKKYCSGWSKVSEKVSKVIDSLAWKILPSAIGIDYGIQMQYGLFAEAEVTPFEKQILYNWRSKQLSEFVGSGTGGYLGSPTIFGITGYVGVMTVYGASDNSFIAGHSKQLGATAQADVVANAGINKVVGASWDTKNKTPFLDPVSNLPVVFRQTNLVGGINAFPDGLDVGIFAGESDSEMRTQP